MFILFFYYLTDYYMNTATDKNKTSRTEENHQCKNMLFIFINLFLIAFPTICFIYKNRQTVNLLNFPVNSEGKSCNLQFEQSYRYLYADLNREKMIYRCVNQCPSMINSYTIMDSNGLSIISPQSQQVVNNQLGGVCWSSLKEKLIKERGLLNEFQTKSFLLNKFQSIVYLCGISFILGMLSLLTFFCLPSRIVYIATISLSFILLGLFFYFLFHNSIFLYKTQLIILVGIIFAFLVINLFIFRQKLFDSIKFSQDLKQKLSSNKETTALSKFCTFMGIDTLFSIIHCGLLILILWIYIGIISSEPLTKKQNEIYYNISRTWWKYIILLFYWLLFSILLQKIYQYLIIKKCYSFIHEGQQDNCFTFGDILNIYHITLIETLLWIPIKMIKFIKPQGSIVNQVQDESFSQKISRCCYCFCGFPINTLHKFTFNPFLVLALQPTISNIDDCLALVQGVYHKHDPSYDRSSLWLYRLSSYINVSILTILIMSGISIYSQQLSKSIFSNWFMILSVVVAVEISQYQIMMWSLLTEISQFIKIIKNTPKLTDHIAY